MMKVRPNSQANTRPAARREHPVQRKARAGRILRQIRKDFPGAATALLHDNPFQLLVATILSAQCTDERVNMVTPGLFRKYPTAETFATLDQSVLEQEIRSTGFYRMKAKNIIGCSKALVERHGGVVPRSMEELVLLPGVGRKTANVVLGQAFGLSAGIVVDTHVHRLAQRMGFTAADTPEAIEQDLLEIFPKSDWIDVGSVLILHGRKVCNARKPNCPACSVRKLCPSFAHFMKLYH
jgi:endonuclease III